MDTKKQELIRQFLHTMLQVRRLVDHSFAISSEEKQATLLQIHALGFIKYNPSSTVGSLAKELRMSSSAIAQLTERLVDAHLVSRKNDSSDRRLVRLTLTAKGEQKMHLLEEKMLKKAEKIYQFIPEEDLAQIVRITSDLLKNLENQKGKNEK